MHEIVLQCAEREGKEEDPRRCVHEIVVQSAKRERGRWEMLGDTCINLRLMAYSLWLMAYGLWSCQCLQSVSMPGSEFNTAAVTFDCGIVPILGDGNLTMSGSLKAHLWQLGVALHEANTSQVCISKS